MTPMIFMIPELARIPTKAPCPTQPPPQALEPIHLRTPPSPPVNHPHDAHFSPSSQRRAESWTQLIHHPTIKGIQSDSSTPSPGLGAGVTEASQSHPLTLQDHACHGDRHEWPHSTAGLEGSPEPASFQGSHAELELQRLPVPWKHFPEKGRVRKKPRSAKAWRWKATRILGGKVVVTQSPRSWRGPSGKNLVTRGGAGEVALSDSIPRTSVSTPGIQTRARRNKSSSRHSEDSRQEDGLWQAEKVQVLLKTRAE